MPSKSCRHASQALRLSDFRRGLRHHNALACELCVAPPPARGNSRSKMGASGKQNRRSGNSKSPEATGGMGDSTASANGNAMSFAVETLNGWAPNPMWEDLYVCISCGHMACLGRNHFMLHFQLHPKHFVGFHVASKTFWCCPCKHEIDGSKAKIQEMMIECKLTLEEITGKQQRRVKAKLVSNPTLSPDDDDEMNTQRSYVYDDETSRGMDVEELMRAMEATTTADDADVETTESVPERPRSITFGTPQSRALEKQLRSEAVQEKEERERIASERRTPSPPPMALPLKNAVPARAPSVLGFSNLGNTCYFNAATQALLTAMHYFPAFIYEDQVINRLGDSPVAATLMMLKGTIVVKTRNLPPLSRNDDIGSNKNRSAAKKPTFPVLTVAPLLKEVRKKFGQFRGNYQQDAHELFTSMLWAIDEEIDPPPVNTGPPQGEAKSPQPQEQEDLEEPELVNLFVKTDTGGTISLRVSPHATKEEIHALLAKKLDLDDSDVFLQPSSGRSTVSTRRLSGVRYTQGTESFSKVNFVRTLFNGALITEVRCRACGNASETVEDAFQLSLPIPSASNGNKYITVAQCLQQFTAESHLLVDAENGYDCEKCSRPPKKTGTTRPPVTLRDATMRLRISELPRVLVLHLKRLGRQRKISEHIQFEAMLDMASHVEDDVVERHESTLYELIAVVVHKGNKRAGHYVAYVSRKKIETMSDGEELSLNDQDIFTKTTRSTMLTLDDPDHNWFYVSDSVVQSVPFDQVLKCEAYMLFYQQVAPSAEISFPSFRSMAVSELRESQICIADVIGRNSDAEHDSDAGGDTDIGRDTNIGRDTDIGRDTEPGRDTDGRESGVWI